MNEEKLLSLATDKEFANILAQVDTDENVQLFAEKYGVKLSLDEAHKLRETAKLYKEKNSISNENNKSEKNVKLDDAALDGISAGSGFWNKLGTTLAVTLGVSTVAVVSAAMGYELRRDQEGIGKGAVDKFGGENVFEATYNQFKK